MKQRRLSSSGLLWLLYTLYVVYGGTLPFHFTTDPAFVAAKLHRLPLNPLIEPDTGRRLSMPDVTQNVIFFLPFGFLGALAQRTAGRRGARSVGQLLLLGAALSCAVEAMQLFTLDRVTSVSDVLADTLGSVLGAVVAVSALSATLVNFRATPLLRKLRDRRAFVLAAALAFLCLGAWVPFDATIEVGTIASHVRALRADLWQVGPWLLQNPDLSVLGPTLVSVAAAMWLHRQNAASAAVTAATASLVVSIAVTVAQCFVTSRLPGLAAILAATVGAAAGAAWWLTAEASDLPRVGWIIALLVATLTVQLLDVGGLGVVWPRLEGFGPDPGQCSTALFVTIWRGLGRAILYLPLGFALGQTDEGHHRRVHAVAIALGGGAVVEVVRRLVGCQADLFAVVAGGLGAWLGYQIGVDGSVRWTALVEAVAQP